MEAGAFDLCLQLIVSISRFTVRALACAPEYLTSSILPMEGRCVPT